MILSSIFPLIAFLSHTAIAQYSGYNAVGGHREGDEKSPLILPDSYHRPSDKENAPHLYWQENRPTAHGHTGHLDSLNGKLHQHFGADEDGSDVPQGEGFVTDPPGIGLNSPDGSDNYDGISGGRFPIRINEFTPNNTFGRNIDEIEVAGSAISEENTTPHSGVADNELPCCSCCDGDSSNGLSPGSVSTQSPNGKTNGNITPARSGWVSGTVPGGAVGSSINGRLGPNRLTSTSGAAGASQVPSLLSQPYSPSYSQIPSYSQNPYSPFGGNSGCSSGYGCSQQQQQCCPQIPQCCPPVIPCCPPIQLPQCCSQPICCAAPQQCGPCRSRVLRSRRVKRSGCLQCSQRHRRSVEHIRRKRFGCIPCLHRSKRHIPSNCQRCSPFLAKMVKRAKRSALFQSCNSQCSPLKRSRRSSKLRETRAAEQCDRSCCDYSQCPSSQH